MNFPRFFKNSLIVILTGCLSFCGFQCGRSEPVDGPKFILKNPRILIKTVISNYITVPRFDSYAEVIIFNGRLDGDSWDCIYTIPVEGGEYRKLIEDTDDLLYPSFSDDRSKIVYTKGFARQIHLFDIKTGQKKPLPFFGNNPLLLPDNETVLYSGVIDANLKAFHIPTLRSKNITESYVSANFSPILLSDQLNIFWIEKRKDGRNQINQTPLDIVEPLTCFTESKFIRGITASPSGAWIIANFNDGSLLAVHPEDTMTARVEIQTDDQSPAPLISLPDWAITGDKLVCTSVSNESNTGNNPFFQRGYFAADLILTDIVWEKISSVNIFKPRIPQFTSLFPEMENLEDVLAQIAARNNNPPKIISDPPETVMQGDIYIYRVNTVDIDQFDMLEYRQLSGPASAEILPKSGIFYYPANTPGNYDFTIAVEDGKGMQDVQNFTVTVLPKPDWANTATSRQAKSGIKNEYIAGLVFKDPNQDGWLSAGEEASLLIDLRTRTMTMDSVKLQILTSVGSGEIEMDDELIFERCEPHHWSRKIISLKGLDGLQNRPIVIRGIIQDSKGINILPASLTISAQNPNCP